MRTVTQTAIQPPIRIIFWMGEIGGQTRRAKCQIMIKCMWERTNEKQRQKERKEEKEREELCYCGEIIM